MRKDSVMAFYSEVVLKRMGKTILRTKTGFSLIEILIGVTLVSVAFLALGQMQIMSIYGNAFANRVTGAVTSAQDKIEELRGVSYAQIISGADNPEIYTRVWNVTNGPVAGTKTVSVTVSWQHKGQHQVQLQTVIAE